VTGERGPERWLDVPLCGDIRRWASDTAREVAARAGLKGREQRKLAEILEGAGQIVQRAQDASMGLLVWEPIRAFVRFCPVDLAGADDDLASPRLREWLLPDESWEEPAEITQIPTKAGTCYRVRAACAGEGNVRGEGEQLAYAWVFPEYGATGVIMAAAFLRLEEAGRWRTVVDELAARAGS
jgi:hypothetical protein